MGRRGEVAGEEGMKNREKRGMKGRARKVNELQRKTMLLSFITTLPELHFTLDKAKKHRKVKYCSPTVFDSI